MTNTTGAVYLSTAGLPIPNFNCIQPASPLDAQRIIAQPIIDDKSCFTQAQSQIMTPSHFPMAPFCLSSQNFLNTATICSNPYVYRYIGLTHPTSTSDTPVTTPIFPTQNYGFPMQIGAISQPTLQPSIDIAANNNNIQEQIMLQNMNRLMKSTHLSSTVTNNKIETPSISSTSDFLTYTKIKADSTSNLNIKEDLSSNQGCWDHPPVFSPSQRSSTSNLQDSPLRIRDDDESTIDNFQFDEEVDLMTPDPERKHLNKEYLASLSMQAQSDPDIFGKVSFIVFQELIDSEFLSPELKQRARHYRRRHRNKLAAKICRDKKQNKIKDLNGEIDELKKQIYMVKSERDMLRTEVEKLSEVHLQKGEKDN